MNWTTLHPATHVTIVRHGEAVYHSERGYAAEACPGLTNRGHAQAECAAAHLAAQVKPFEVLYASPRRRCIETAEPIAKALHLELSVAMDLRSPDHGPGEPSNTATNLLDTIPPFAPTRMPLPGAETWASYMHRASGFLDALPDRHPGARVLIVGHAETQDAAMAAYLGLGGDWRTRAFQYSDHTAISRWRHSRVELPGAYERGLWALVAHNDSHHLAGTSLETARPE